MMRIIFISLSVLAILAAHITRAAEGGSGTTDTFRKETRIVVVVSTKNPFNSIRLAELARIYLRKKIQWPNGESITAYDRPAGNRIRQEFSQKILGKSPKDLREYWMNLQLTRGLKPPKVLRSAKLVKRYLTRVKGGIGYLYEDEIDDTVKVLQIIWKNNP